MVVVDEYSRFVKVQTVFSTSAGAFIPKLDKIFGTLGIPKLLRTDYAYDPPFTSHSFKVFASKFLLLEIQP